MSCLPLLPCVSCLVAPYGCNAPVPSVPGPFSLPVPDAWLLGFSYQYPILSWQRHLTMMPLPLPLLFLLPLAPDPLWLRLPMLPLWLCGRRLPRYMHARPLGGLQLADQQMSSAWQPPLLQDLCKFFFYGGNNYVPRQVLGEELSLTSFVHLQPVQ